MARTPTTRRAPTPAPATRREVTDLFADRVLVCDGAMGTMLQAAGVSLDLSLPELSVTRPELVKAIHGAYIAAGADIIETNTFGACRTRLGRFGLEGRVAEINLAAVRVARSAVVATDRTVLVAGPWGPQRRRRRAGAWRMRCFGMPSASRSRRCRRAASTLSCSRRLAAWRS